MQHIMHMQNMQNMPHLHAHSALQQSVDFSCILGHQSRRNKLQLFRSCIVHQKAEPPSVACDWVVQTKYLRTAWFNFVHHLEDHLFCSMEGAFTCVRRQEPEN